MAVHVLSKGDNLSSISKRYGVSINTIVNTNGLSLTGALVPGLALFIPDTALPVRTYAIKAGDTLSKLSAQFHSNLSLIRVANAGININNLQIGQIINIPSMIKLPMATVSFFVPSTQASDLFLLASLSGELTYLAVVAYSFTNQGFAYNQVEDTAIVHKCKQLNIIPLLMIRNYTAAGYDAELAGAVLQNPAYRQNLVQSIATLTKQRGFGGVSLDFEFIPPARRNDFNLFLVQLKKELGSLLLQVNVHAKAADLPTNRIVGAYDYAEIGNASDLMAVMTIDYGYPGGPPEPIAPIGWVGQVVNYALTKVNRKKLLLAIALYGYDKVASTNKTQGLSVLTAQNKAISTGANIEYDNIAKSPWFRYWSGSTEHVVWFEDIRSYMEKYKLIDVYQLAGTTFWQIALPAPQNWAYIKKNIAIVKPRT